MMPGLPRRRPFILPLPVLLLAGLALGCGQSPPPPEKPPPAPVRAVRAWRTSLDEWVEFPGATQPLPRLFARVTAAVEGRVLSVLPEAKGPSAAEGQWVEQGQVILRLDNRIARANLAKARSAVTELTPQEKQAVNAVQLARNRVERIKGLKGSTIAGTKLPLVSSTEAEQARIALRDAEAQLQGVKAKQTSAAAAVRAQEEQLRLYTIRAPISGWLSLIQVAPGQTMSVGTHVADIVDLNPIDVLCYVPPSRIGRIALGQPARIGAGAPRAPSSATAEEGKVVYVAVQAQQETGSFAVKVRFPNAARHLRANALVRVFIRTAAPEQRLVIPEGALLEDREPPEVVVVGRLHAEEGGQVGEVYHYRAVVGVRNRQRRLVEIRGLEPVGKEGKVPALDAAWFVVAGGRGLHDGDEVRVTRVAGGTTK